MVAKVKEKCFVIMPFTGTSEKHTEEYWTKHFEDFIKPLVESRHPLKAERSSPLRADILRQIITDLVTAPVVVADLTDANPNVYWELGVRQSFKHGTITIAEYGTELPFDVGSKGSLFYFPDNHIKMQEFIQKFNQAIEDCLKNPHLTDSQVLETISGRGTLYQVLTRDESIRKLEALISEIERDESIFQHIIDICNKNIKNREEALKNGKAESEADVSYVTSRCRFSAIEMLITSRYVSAENKFYETAELYMDRLIAINDQLAAWENSPKSTERWFLRVQDSTKSRANELKTLAIEQKKALKTTL